jgi:hypothetical protein
MNERRARMENGGHELVEGGCIRVKGRHAWLGKEASMDERGVHMARRGHTVGEGGAYG